MSRIYSVETDETMQLVDANSQSQALAHVARQTYTVRVASGKDVAEYVKQGGEIEDANADPANAEAEAEQAAADQAADPSGQSE